MDDGLFEGGGGSAVLFGGLCVGGREGGGGRDVVLGFVLQERSTQTEG